MGFSAGAYALIGAITGAGATAATSLYGANKQANATQNAQNIQSQSNAAAIAEQKSQDATQLAEFNAQQAALQNQWNAEQQIRAPYRAAGAAALSKVGDILGTNFDSSNSPSYAATPYVPITAPGGTTTAPTGTAATPAATGTPSASSSTTANPTDPAAIAAQLQANYAALGVTPTGPGTGPTDLSYYATQIAATGGLTPQNSAYWFGPTGRIATDLSTAKSGAATAPASPMAGVNAASSLAPTMALPTAAGTSPSYAPVVPISALMGSA